MFYGQMSRPPFTAHALFAPDSSWTWRAPFVDAVYHLTDGQLTDKEPSGESHEAATR